MACDREAHEPLLLAHATKLILMPRLPHLYKLVRKILHTTFHRIH